MTPHGPPADFVHPFPNSAAEDPRAPITIGAPSTTKPVIRAFSLAAQVYEELRRRITEGLLEEEQSLVIAAIVRELGISQTPVREALARLHAEGLAEFTENVGYRVAGRPSDADYRHWMEARLIIEVNSIRQAATRVTAEQSAQLRTINETIAKTTFGSSFEEVRRFAELNATFHRELILISGNPFIVRAHGQIWLGAQFSRVHIEQGVVDQARIVTEHEAIIEALSSGDSEGAARAMERHIIDSLGRDASRRFSPQSG